MVISSSMVYENATAFPTPEGHELFCPPPFTSYGFQKLMAEYYARAAKLQYDLPYTIIRPFNCVGTYETQYPHALSELVTKCLKKPSSLPIYGDGFQVRSYTNGRDIARGIRLAMESKEAQNEDFNIASPELMTVFGLAKKIWDEIIPERRFDYHSEKTFPFDVRKRIPDVSKAKKILKFEAEIPLIQSIRETIKQARECN